jgi:hypothetical protein
MGATARASGRLDRRADRGARGRRCERRTTRGVDQACAQRFGRGPGALRTAARGAAARAGASRSAGACARARPCVGSPPRSARAVPRRPCG